MNDEPMSAYDRALDLMDQERWSGAIDVLESIVASCGDDYRIFWNLGWAHFKLEEFGPAIAHLSRAVELAPVEPVCYWALGIVELKAEQLLSAEQNLSKALEIRDSTIARQGLALVLMKQERLEEAEQVHLDGIRLKPNSAERHEAYADFLSDVGYEDEADREYKLAMELEGDGPPLSP